MNSARLLNLLFIMSASCFAMQKKSCDERNEAVQKNRERPFLREEILARYKNEKRHSVEIVRPKIKPYKSPSAGGLSPIPE